MHSNTIVQLSIAKPGAWYVCPIGCTITPHNSVAPFSAGERRVRGRGDRSVLELASIVKATLEQTILTELLPKSQIDVFVQVLQSDGGVRGCCINAAIVALGDASIPLRSLAAACTVGLVDNTPLLDLNYMEDSQRKPTVTMALQTGPDRVALLQSDQRVKVEDMERMMELGSHGCRAVATYMRQQLLVHVKQLAKARGPTTL